MQQSENLRATPPLHFWGLGKGPVLAYTHHCFIPKPLVQFKYAILPMLLGMSFTLCSPWLWVSGPISEFEEWYVGVGHRTLHLQEPPAVPGNLRLLSKEFVSRAKHSLQFA